MLVGALTPDDEEAMEGERERIRPRCQRFLRRYLLQVNQHFQMCLLNQVASTIVSWSDCLSLSLHCPFIFVHYSENLK
jgi:hypothetical protein